MSAPLPSSSSAPEVPTRSSSPACSTAMMRPTGRSSSRHQDLIYRHARGMGLDHDTSLDLVQDAFVRAFDRLEDCRDGANYRAWLFRICRNLCLDELRNVRRLSRAHEHHRERGDHGGPARGRRRHDADPACGARTASRRAARGVPAQARRRLHVRGGGGDHRGVAECGQDARAPRA